MIIMHHCYFVPSKGVRCHDQHVCLSVCPLSCLKDTPQISANVLYMLCVAIAQSCDGKWQCNMLCTSGFAADVLFSHNGANGP